MSNPLGRSPSAKTRSSASAHGFALVTSPRLGAQFFKLRAFCSMLDKDAPWARRESGQY